MANKIIHKHNKQIIPAVPVLSSLEIGELAIDNISGKLYTRKGTNVANDTIVEISGSGGTGGGIHSLSYLWKTAIDTSPANGIMTGDNVVMVSITKLYVNKVDSSGHDKSLFIQEIEVGTELILHDHNESDINMVFNASALPTLTGNAFTIPVIFVSKKGADFTNNENINLHWNASNTGSAKRYEFYADAGHLKDFPLDEPLSDNALVSVNGNTVSDKDYEANSNNIRFLITLKPADFIVVLNNAPSSSGGGGGSSTFIDLTDTPAAYVAGQGVYVNPAGDGLVFSAGTGTPSTGLEKVTVGGKTGMRVIDAADTGAINTFSMNLDPSASITDIGSEAIAIGNKAKASGDYAIAIGSSVNLIDTIVVAGARGSIVIGSAIADEVMTIHETASHSIILGGQRVSIPALVTNTSVIGGVGVTPKQSNMMYVPAIKHKAWETHQIINKHHAEEGTIMYDRMEKIFMRCTKSYVSNAEPAEWHGDSPSGLEHVVHDGDSGLYPGTGVKGTKIFTIGDTDDHTSSFNVGDKIHMLKLAVDVIQQDSEVVSVAYTGTPKHTVVTVKDALIDIMMMISYPTAPAENGWNFYRTAATSTGKNSVNLTTTHISTQEGLVLCHGIQYTPYTTGEIAARTGAQLGTILFDSDKNQLVQCIDETKGATVWAATGGELTRAHQELRPEYPGTLTAGTKPAYTFAIDTASGDVTAKFPHNAVFILEGGGFNAQPYTVDTATFAAGVTTIHFTNPYLTDVPAYTKIGEQDHWGWKVASNPSVTIGESAVNLMIRGDAPQPNMTYVGGVKYKNYTTAEISVLPGTEAGTVVYDSTKNELQYYNGTAWSDLGGLPTTRFEEVATNGQTLITLPNRVRDAAIVSIKGVILMSTAYTVVDKTITLTTGLHNNDEIIVTNMGV